MAVGRPARAGAASAARSATTARSKERREEDTILVCLFFQLVNAKREGDWQEEEKMDLFCRLRSISRRLELAAD